MEKPNIFSAVLTKCWVFVRFFLLFRWSAPWNWRKKKERKGKKGKGD